MHRLFETSLPSRWNGASFRSHSFVSHSLVSHSLVLGSVLFACCAPASEKAVAADSIPIGIVTPASNEQAASSAKEAAASSEAQVNNKAKAEKEAKAQSYAGTVLDASGKPVAAASIAVVLPGKVLLVSGTELSESMVATKSDATGHFTFNPPEEEDARYQLVIVAPAGFYEQAGGELPQAGTFKLTPWGKVTGQVKIDDQPEAKVQVQLMPASGSTSLSRVGPNVMFRSMAMTDDDGKYTIEHAKPGPAVLFSLGKTASGGLSPRHPQVVDVVSGKTTQVAEEAAGRTVTARLALPEDSKEKLEWTYGTYRVVRQPQMTAPPKRAKGTTDEEYAATTAKFMADRQLESMLTRFPYLASVDKSGMLKVQNLPPGKYTLSGTVNDPPEAGSQQPGDDAATVSESFTVEAASEARTCRRVPPRRCPAPPRSSPSRSSRRSCRSRRGRPRRRAGPGAARRR